MPEKRSQTPAADPHQDHQIAARYGNREKVLCEKVALKLPVGTVRPSHGLQAMREPIDTTGVPFTVDDHRPVDLQIAVDFVCDGRVSMIKVVGAVHHPWFMRSACGKDRRKIGSGRKPKRFGGLIGGTTQRIGHRSQQLNPAPFGIGFIETFFYRFGTDPRPQYVLHLLFGGNHGRGIRWAVDAMTCCVVYALPDCGVKRCGDFG